MSIETVRRKNLLRLAELDDSQLAFAGKLGLTAQYLNQLLMGHRNIGEKTARKIEAKLKLAAGALDRDIELEAATLKSACDLPIDQATLLSGYRQLSPEHQNVVRELVTMYARLDQQPS